MAKERTGKDCVGQPLKVGDWVFTSKHGIGQITRITPKMVECEMKNNKRSNRTEWRARQLECAFLDEAYVLQWLLQQETN